MDPKTLEKVYNKLEDVVKKTRAKDPDNKCVVGLGVACQLVYDMYIESMYKGKSVSGHSAI